MENYKHEEGVCHRFDFYCKKILKHRHIDHYRTMKRRGEREAFFSELPWSDLVKLTVADEYFTNEYTFSVLGESVSLSNYELAKALSALPSDGREIVLMKYFLDMSDRKIAERLNMARRTVSHRRDSSLRKLRKLMESE